MQEKFNLYRNIALKKFAFINWFEKIIWRPLGFSRLPMNATLKAFKNNKRKTLYWVFFPLGTGDFRVRFSDERLVLGSQFNSLLIETVNDGKNWKDDSSRFWKTTIWEPKKMAEPEQIVREFLQGFLDSLSMIVVYIYIIVLRSCTPS